MKIKCGYFKVGWFYKTLIGMTLAVSVYFNFALYSIVKDYNIVSTSLNEEVSVLSKEVDTLSRYEKGWNALTAGMGLSEQESKRFLDELNRRDR